MSDFNNIHRVPRIEPYVPDRTELLGDNTKQYADTDIGKPVKYSGAAMVLCADGDPVVGFVTAIEPYSSSGYSVGSVKMDVNTEFLATDEDGGLAVGDLVVAGTPVALGTANGANGPNVRRQSVGSLLVSGALQVKAAAKPTAESAAAMQAIVNGVLVTKAAGDMAALSGTVDNADFNAFGFFINEAGTLSTVMGTAGATQAAVVLPAAPAASVMVGYVIINPTGTGDFVGATTDLDDATVVPNAVFVNTVGPVASSSAHRWQVASIYVDPSVAGTQVMLRKVG